MKNEIKEFRDFAMKGNVIDLAVGVIIGGAFGKIISSLVSDVVMPLLGVILGKINLANLQWTPVPNLSIKYGSFLQAVLDFFIIALSIFLSIKLLNKLRIKKVEESKPISDEIKLLTEIRDLLKEEKES